VVIHVVKAGLGPGSILTENPAFARVSRTSGLVSERLMDRVYALPNVARYQLRYTRIFSFCHYITLGTKIKDFPVCGHSCGQGRISARFRNPKKSRKCPCCKAFRAFTFQVVDSVETTPKAGALPTALHPVMKFSGHLRLFPKATCQIPNVYYFTGKQRKVK